MLFELGPAAVASVRSLLWELLTELEELSTATMSVMQLLSQLYGGGSGAAGAGGDAGLGGDAGAGAGEGDGGDLVQLVPRLWLFLRHSMSSVRLSSMQCLERLLLGLQKQQQLEGGSAAAGAEALPSSWLPSLLPVLLLLAFQNLLLESDDRVLQCTLRVWALLLACSPREGAAAAASPPMVRSFFLLASTPTGAALDRSHMVQPQLDLEDGSVKLVELNSVSCQAASARSASLQLEPAGSKTSAQAPTSRLSKKVRRGRERGGSSAIHSLFTDPLPSLRLTGDSP
jgi:hypothetical protein